MIHFYSGEEMEKIIQENEHILNIKIFKLKEKYST
jgi:Holliday junction resolvasome RuvABC ATP-dependent DNA helicase subunit